MNLMDMVLNITPMDCELHLVRVVSDVVAECVYYTHDNDTRVTMEYDINVWYDTDGGVTDIKCVEYPELAINFDLVSNYSEFKRDLSERIL